VKPPTFSYHVPRTLAETVQLLQRVGDDGKILAGGQSLVPMLNMRLLAPGHLIDLNRVAELSYVRVDGHGVTIGAMARHAAVERDDSAYAAQPLLRRALRLVAHPVIRNRGTTVGSLAHADPSGELPAVLALLEGSVEIASMSGVRVVGAQDFFVGPLETSLRPGEVVSAARFPRSPHGTGTAFVEVSRRHGDYAVAGLAAAVQVDGEGRVGAARAAYISVAPVPQVVDLSDAVTGQPVDSADWAAAGALAAAAVDPEPDIHATAAYRRELVRVLTVRALGEAAARASQEGGRG